MAGEGEQAGVSQGVRVGVGGLSFLPLWTPDSGDELFLRSCPGQHLAPVSFSGLSTFPRCQTVDISS